MHICSFDHSPTVSCSGTGADATQAANSSRDAIQSFMIECVLWESTMSTEHSATRIPFYSFLHAHCSRNSYHTENIYQDSIGSVNAFQDP